jgi:hypothetical protein
VTLVRMAGGSSGACRIWGSSWVGESGQSPLRIRDWRMASCRPKPASAGADAGKPWKAGRWTKREITTPTNVEKDQLGTLPTASVERRGSHVGKLDC